MPTYDEILNQARQQKSAPATQGKKPTPTIPPVATSSTTTTQTSQSTSPESSVAFQIGKGLRDILTNKESLPTLWESFKTGTKKTGANLLQLGSVLNEASPVTKLMEAILPKSMTESRKSGTEAIIESIFSKTKQQKESYTKDKSGGQKFLYDVGEYVPAQIATLLTPIPGDEVATAAPLLKLFGLAGKEVAESQLIYNPLEHADEDQLKARMEDALFNVGAWGVAEGTGRIGKKAIETMAIKPMKWAINTIADRQIKKVESETLENLAPFINGGINEVLDSDKIKLDRTTFLDTVKGVKPIDSETREFFSTPEWRSVVKQYGTDIANYPETVKVLKPVAEDSILETQGLMGLLEAPKVDIYNTIAADVADISQDLASMSIEKVEQKSGKLGMLLTMLDEAQSRYNLKIDRPGVSKLINNLAENIRNLDDFNMGVANIEMKQGVYDMLDQAGILSPLVELKKISSGVMAEKAQFSPDSFLAEVFDKKMAGITDAAELVDRLKELGFGVNEAADLIEFVQDIPSKTQLKQLRTALKPVKPIDVQAELQQLVKIDDTVKIETPYLLAKAKESQLEKQLLSQETTQFEKAKPLIDESMSPEVKQSVSDAGVAIAQTQAPDVDKIGVSQAIYNMAAISDPKVSAATAFDALPSYANAILAQVENIASSPIPEVAGQRTGLIADLFEKAKSFLFNNKITSSLFSAQNKMFSTSTARVNGMYQFLDNSTQALTRASKRMEDELYTRLRPETFNIFADALEKGTYDSFTPAEKEAVDIWQSYARNILQFTNTLRVALGKSEIPLQERYFPRQIQDVIKSTLTDTVENEKLLNEFDSRAIYKRTLQNLSTAIHEKDIRNILPIYFNSNMLHINSLVRQYVNKQTNNYWEDVELETFKSRMKMSAWTPDVEQEWAGAFYEFGKGVGNALQTVAEKLKLKKVEQVPISKETKEWLMANEKLSQEKAIIDAVKKGYFDVRKSDWGKTLGTITNAPLLLSSTVQLMLNASFTATNMLQVPVASFKTFGISSLPSAVKAWTKSYVFNTASEIVGFSYAKEQKNILETLGYLGARQSTYGDGITMLDFLGKFGRGLTWNITWTEQNNRLAGMFLAEDLLNKRLVNISKPEAKRIAAEFSAAFNFIAGKYTNPSIKTSWLGRQLYQFQQFPISDSILTLNAWENVVSKDKSATDAFYNIISGIGDKELLDRVKPQIKNLAPSSIDNLSGLLASYATTYAATVSTINLFNIAYGFLIDKEPEINTSRAEKLSKETVTPFAGVISPLTTALSKVGSTSPSADVLSEFRTPSLDVQANMVNLVIFGSKKIQAMATGDVVGAYDADEKMEQTIQKLAPVFIQRTTDFFDAVSSGSVYSKTQKGQVQYSLSKDKAESPLTVLFFGRGALGESQEYLETASKVGAKDKLNEDAKSAFFKSLETKDPSEKEKYMSAYRKLLQAGAKKVTPDQVKEREKRKGTNLIERTKEQLPKEQRNRL